ncbi:MAG: AAA family ATPase [gamma proteobacterium symbiont of Clathrolucina costata]
MNKRLIGFKDNRFTIEFEYKPALRDQLKLIEGAGYDADSQRWTMPTGDQTARNALKLFALANGFELTEAAQKAIDSPPPKKEFDFDFIPIAQAFNEKPPELDFVLPGLVAGTVGMLASSGGVGKTNLSTLFGISLVAGLPVAGGIWEPQAQGEVTILAAEDSTDILRNRLYSIKGWLQKNHADKFETIQGDLEDGFNIMSLDGHIPHLINGQGQVNADWLSVIERAATDQRLLILDTFRMFFGGDENSTAHVSLFIQNLKVIASKTGASILFTHHINKAASLNGASLSAEAASGAGAFTTNVRWQANLAGMTEAQAKAFGFDEDEQRQHICLAIPKANHIAPEPIRWMRRKEGGVLEHIELTPNNIVSIKNGRNGQQRKGKDAP